jgi:hypothetical protein
MLEFSLRARDSIRKSGAAARKLTRLIKAPEFLSGMERGGTERGRREERERAAHPRTEAVLFGLQISLSTAARLLPQFCRNTRPIAARGAAAVIIAITSRN